MGNKLFLCAANCCDFFSVVFVVAGTAIHNWIALALQFVAQEHPLLMESVVLSDLKLFACFTFWDSFPTCRTPELLMQEITRQFGLLQTNSRFESDFETGW